MDTDGTESVWLRVLHRRSQEVVLGPLLRPEGPKFEAESGWEIYGERACCPSPPARGPVERYKLPQPV